MGNQNPFSSATYKSVWLKHFSTYKASATSFGFFSGLEFIRGSKFPVYTNVGKTLTKGVDYSINLDTDASALKDQTFLIYDVPEYFNIDTSQLPLNVALLKSKQYPGFLIETDQFDNLEAYMLSNFSKNSRNKLRKFKRRLETSFNLEYKMFLGEISKTEYDFIFSEFKRLLEKRFADKQITNNNLNQEEWDFYFEVAYPLILEKKASLFVIFDNEKPIGITLCYLSNETLFDAITVFDIDYFKFHLGSVTIMKLIEWCIENNIKILDFSKGYFDYKTRWCTKTYDFEYHVYYDKTSLKSKLIANSVKRFYDLKQTLREKHLNEKLHKFTYSLKNNTDTNQEKLTFNFEEPEIALPENSLKPIKIEEQLDNNLRLLIFEFLYLFEERHDDLKFFKVKGESKKYVIKGKAITRIATIEAEEKQHKPN